jgi:hypothetical protein
VSWVHFGPSPGGAMTLKFRERFATFSQRGG